jgi:hypothetical protein
MALTIHATIVLKRFISQYITILFQGHDNVAITIDHPHKMMILGTSKDLAVCSGKNSKTGRSCRNYINKYSL